MSEVDYLNFAATLAIVGLGCFLPLSTAFALLTTVTLAPFIRVAISLGGTELGIRPEDALLLVLLVRTAHIRVPPLAVELKRLKKMLFWVVAWIGVYYTYSLFHYALSDVSFYLLVKMLGALGMLYVARRVIRTRRQYEQVLLGAVIGGLILATTASYSSAATIQEGGGMYDVKAANAAGLASWNPNWIGLTLGALCVLLIAILPGLRGRWNRLLCLIVICFFTSSVVRSYSRTSLIALVIATALGFIRSLTGGQRQRVGLAVLALAALLVLLLPAFQGEAFRISFAQGENVGARTIIWAAGVSSVMERPFGYGAGVGDLSLAKYIGERYSAHNDWLDYALEIGIPGSILALCTVIYLITTFSRAVKRNPGSHLAISFEGLIVYFFICSMAGQVFTFSKPPFLLLAPAIVNLNFFLSQSACPRLSGGVLVRCGGSAIRTGKSG